MKKVIIAILTIMISSSFGIVTFDKTFGGTGSEVGSSVQQTIDGGYIITGRTDSYGEGATDAWLIKTDASGNQTWAKTFGGIYNDYTTSVRQTTDGGYILTGIKNSWDPNTADAWLIKTDASGNQTWAKTFGGASYDDMGTSVQQTTDGGYIITGYTGSYGSGGTDVWLIKTSASGNQTWLKTFGGINNDMGQSVKQTKEGGYIIAGYTDSYGAGLADVWLIKTNENGIQTWAKTFGGAGSDMGSSVQETKDGGYIIAGGTDPNNIGSKDVLLIKTNENGIMTWSKTFGGSKWDSAQSVQQTADDGYIITGYTNSYGAGGSDLWLIKTDSDGNETWSKTFGSTGSDVGFFVQQTPDGGYIIIGRTNSYGAGSTDAWLIKTDGSGSVGIEDNNFIDVLDLYQNYPNPFNPITTIKYSLKESSYVKLEIYNIKGIEICSLVNQKQDVGLHEVNFNGNMLTSGIYLYRLCINDIVVHYKKMILLK